MENFFNLLSKNVLNQQFWTTCEQLRLAIVYWIEALYHCRRRLGKLTTIDFETVIGDTTALTAQGNESAKGSAFPFDSLVVCSGRPLRLRAKSV